MVRLREIYLMFLFVISTFGLLALFALAFHLNAQPPNQERSIPTAPEAAKVMREYRGVKLGLKAVDVRAVIGKPQNTREGREEYKLGGDDLMTIHYENGAVKVIQLFFANPKNAPEWTAVVGDTTIEENSSGSKQARVVIGEENFWVAMFQSKDKSITTITISR